MSSILTSITEHAHNNTSQLKPVLTKNSQGRLSRLDSRLHMACQCQGTRSVNFNKI